MDLIQEYNKRYEFFSEITGEAMKVHRKFHKGLVESAYEAALKYLLEQKGYTVERQHRRQLFSYMHLTHTEYGMIINFGGDSLFSEWYRRDPATGEIEKVRLL